MQREVAQSRVFANPHPQVEQGFFGTQSNAIQTEQEMIRLWFILAADHVVNTREDQFTAAGRRQSACLNDRVKLSCGIHQRANTFQQYGWWQVLYLFPVPLGDDVCELLTRLKPALFGSRIHHAHAGEGDFEDRPEHLCRHEKTKVHISVDDAILILRFERIKFQQIRQFGSGFIDRAQTQCAEQRGDCVRQMLAQTAARHHHLWAGQIPLDGF